MIRQNFVNFAAAMNREITFRFKQFAISDSNCGMKTGTDGVTLGAWVSCRDVHSVIDVGAGSGLISLMIAQRSPVARIHAVEIDPGAASDARFNVDASPWSRRIDVVNDDISHYTPDTPPDLIVSNPPFFNTGETSADSCRVAARHESSLTCRTLLEYACANLADTGRLAIIIPAERSDEIIYNAEMIHLKVRRQCLLHSKPDQVPFRVMIEFMRHDGPIELEDMTIRGHHGYYTPEFKKLTENFYL